MAAYPPGYGALLASTDLLYYFLSAPEKDPHHPWSFCHECCLSRSTPSSFSTDSGNASRLWRPDAYTWPCILAGLWSHASILDFAATTSLCLPRASHVKRIHPAVSHAGQFGIQGAPKNTSPHIDHPMSLFALLQSLDALDTVRPCTVSSNTGHVTVELSHRLCGKPHSRSFLFSLHLQNFFLLLAKPIQQSGPGLGNSAGGNL